MSKMSQRKIRRKLSKLRKIIKLPKLRIPIPPPTKCFKSKKNYNRSKNKNMENLDE